MGMDVYGREPINEVGSYFRNNVWWWRPLWNYCVTYHSDLTEEIAENGHTNSGDGLNAKNAYELGKRLQNDIDLGIVADYEKEYKEHLESLPLLDCEYCNATGQRLWPANSINNDSDKDIYRECNSCSGSGKTKDFSTNYPFSVNNVQEFSKFLVCSGGFNIW